jgi:heme/copper-type cytochrome/quinol oxidase subunit 2
MTELEGITLFTTGIRISVLIMLIVVLWNSMRTSVKNSDSLYLKIAHNPKIILTLVVVLLVTSIVQVSIEIYDHWMNP